MSNRRGSRQERQHRREQVARNQRRALHGLAAVVVLGLAVLVGIKVLGDDDGPGTTAPSAATVSMTEFAFSLDPIELPHGRGARLEVVNDGTTAHDLLIGELGMGTPDLAPGQRMVLDLSEQPAGTYRVVCDLPGHTEAGMVTTLVLR